MQRIAVTAAAGLPRRLLAAFDPFIGLLLATVAAASLLPPRGMWVGIAAAAADAGIVLLFFLHGAKLSRQAIIDGARNWRLHGATLAVTFGLFPLLGVACVAGGLIAGPLAIGFLFLTLLPSTVQSSIALTAVARGNVAAAVCGASFSNLLGIFVTPLLVTLVIGARSGGGVSFHAIEGIVGQLLLPFVAGHLLRPWIGDFVARHKPLVTAVDRGSILLVVYVAFGAAVVAGLWSMVAPAALAGVALLCGALLALVLAATAGLGRAMRLPRADRIVLQFCGSKKSLASGVPMAGVLFAPAQVGLIVLPVILYHQIQLIVCAVLARRYAAAADRAAAAVAA